MNKSERLIRIVARGEHSNHCHVITGDVLIEQTDNKTVITVTEDSNASLKHLLEKEWIDGNEVWTKEHKDIELKPGKYEVIHQVEFDPYDKLIKQVKD